MIDNNGNVMSNAIKKNENKEKETGKIKNKAAL